MTSYRVTKKEWTPLSCKLDLFLTILGKSGEVISYWLGLDKSFAAFQVPGNEHYSLVLPKPSKIGQICTKGVSILFWWPCTQEV